MAAAAARLACIRRRAANWRKRWPTASPAALAAARSTRAGQASSRSPAARRRRLLRARLSTRPIAWDKVDGHAGRRALRAGRPRRAPMPRWCGQPAAGQGGRRALRAALSRRPTASRRRPRRDVEELRRTAVAARRRRSSAWATTATPPRSFPMRHDLHALLDADDAARSCCRCEAESAGEPRLTLPLARIVDAALLVAAYRRRGEEGGAAKPRSSGRRCRSARCARGRSAPCARTSRSHDLLGARERRIGHDRHATTSQRSPSASANARRPTREAYLGRLDDAAGKAAPTARRSPAATSRMALPSARPSDKAALGGDRVPNLGIITSYNDMLSAHQPFETFPALIKRGGARGRRHRAGGRRRAGHVRRRHPGPAGHGAVAVFARRDRHGGGGRRSRTTCSTPPSISASATRSCRGW